MKYCPILVKFIVKQQIGSNTLHGKLKIIFAYVNIQYCKMSVLTWIWPKFSFVLLKNLWPWKCLLLEINVHQVLHRNKANGIITVESRPTFSAFFFFHNSPCWHKSTNIFLQCTASAETSCSSHREQSNILNKSLASNFLCSNPILILTKISILKAIHILLSFAEVGNKHGFHLKGRWQGNTEVQRTQ